MTTQQIGLTGNIGSGKTTVGQLFETLGIPVYYADEHAKRFLNTAEVVPQIIKAFGKDCIGSDGMVDRKILAKKVFSDKQLLQKLNDIIHPMVGADFNYWTEKKSDHRYVLMEAAILFETSRSKSLYKNILVKAPDHIRVQRVCERDGVSADDVRERMQHQMSQDAKEKLADFVINNDGLEPLIPQVEKIDHQIKRSLQLPD